VSPPAGITAARICESFADGIDCVFLKGNHDALKLDFLTEAAANLCRAAQYTSSKPLDDVHASIKPR